MANNRVQQRFDRAIREAVEQTAAANARKPRRNVLALKRYLPTDTKAPKGRLYLDKETGATVWDPSPCWHLWSENGERFTHCRKCGEPSPAQQK